MAIPSKGVGGSSPKNQPKAPNSFSRWDLKQKLAGAWQNTILPSEKRKALVDEFFPRGSYGDQISKSRIQQELKKLENKKYWLEQGGKWKEAKDLREKIKILKRVVN
jgi:uncharacterized protein YdaU (DUF1376 family)